MKSMSIGGIPAEAIHSHEDMRLPSLLVASLGLEQVVPVGRPLSWSPPGSLNVGLTPIPLRREFLERAHPPTPMIERPVLLQVPPSSEPLVKKKPKMLSRLFDFLHPHHHQQGEEVKAHSPVILRSSAPGHGHGTLVKLLELLHLRSNSPGGRQGSPFSSSNGLSLSDDEMAIVRERIPLVEQLDDLSFQRKYRFLDSNRVIGKGASGVVRLAYRLGDATVPLAAKEFRRRRRGEEACDYVRKLTAEFAIASRLHHPHVVETFDMVHDGKRWLEVMEWCSGGDLFTAIQAGRIGCDEIDSCFRQLVEGVHYLHSLGVAHRDLKPENLLIDRNGWLKITDFGVSGIFRSGIDDCECCRLVGVCGSSPYIAPEEYVEGVPYDPRPVDVWSCGIILLAMTFHTIPWEQATVRDPNYRRYIEEGQAAFEPFSRMATGARRLLKRILVPDPAQRITLDEIMADPWFRAIQVIPLPGADCPHRNDHLND